MPIPISKEDQELVEVARKYHLLPGSLKCEIFLLFDKGYAPKYVKYLLRDFITSRIDPTLRSINRYYYTWKKAQVNK